MTTLSPDKYRDMVNELRHLVFNSWMSGQINPDRHYDYGRMRTDVTNIVSKYIKAGKS